MPFFRDNDGWDDDPYSSHIIPQTDSEKLETVRWYIWCGWGLDARRILHEIAKDIPDDPEAVSYEEERFAQES